MQKLTILTTTGLRNDISNWPGHSRPSPVHQQRRAHQRSGHKFPAHLNKLADFRLRSRLRVHYGYSDTRSVLHRPRAQERGTIHHAEQRPADPESVLLDSFLDYG